MNIKLYFNTNYILISPESGQLTQNQDVKVFDLRENPEKKLTAIIQDFLTSAPNKVFNLVSPEVDLVLKLLKKQFIYIEAAGGFIENDKRYLFIHRNGLWDLPKGKREPNEGIKDCAIRECEEECGVKNLEIIKELRPSYHIYSYKGSYALKKSYWYYMNTDYNKKLVPQLEENISQVKWFTKTEILDNILPNTYFTIKEVVSDALNL